MIYNNKCNNFGNWYKERLKRIKFFVFSTFELSTNKRLKRIIGCIRTQSPWIRRTNTYKERYKYTHMYCQVSKEAAVGSAIGRRDRDIHKIAVHWRQISNIRPLNGNCHLWLKFYPFLWILLDLHFLCICKNICNRTDIYSAKCSQRHFIEQDQLFDAASLEGGSSQSGWGRGWQGGCPACGGGDSSLVDSLVSVETTMV